MMTWRSEREVVVGSRVRDTVFESGDLINTIFTYRNGKIN